tara:strand:+ start:191 stop:661 length:471 start_codon:yes stop_codon:yes gene_type:complete
MDSDPYRASIWIGNHDDNEEGRVVDAVFHPGLKITGEEFHDNLQDDRGYLPIQSCLDTVADMMHRGFESSGEYKNSCNPFSEGVGDIEFFMNDNLPTTGTTERCETPYGSVWYRVHVTVDTDEIDVEEDTLDTDESEIEEGTLHTIFVFDAATDCP